MQNLPVVAKQFATRHEPCPKFSELTASHDNFVHISREQIRKMREDYALERKSNLQAVLEKRTSLSHSARQHLEKAIETQRAFEKSALIPTRCSDEMVELVKRIDRPFLLSHFASKGDR